MQKTKSQYAIVVINWFHAEETVRCVAEYRKWNISPFPVYVVCNGDTDEGRKLLVEALGDFCNLTFLDENMGYGAANNIGADKAFENGASWTVLVNADARIGEQDFLKLFDAFQSGEMPGAVSPVIMEEHGGREVLYAGGRDISTSRNTRIKLTGAMKSEAVSRFQQRDFLMGTVLVIARNAWKEIGPLDTDYFFSGEVSDWCFRARHKNVPLVVDFEAQASHDVSVAGEEVRDQHHLYYSLRNRFVFIGKNRPDRRILLYPYWLALCCWEGMKSLVKGQPNKAKTIFAAAWDGLIGKTGARRR